ncbi:MAG TPA: hypothetical protein VK169_16920 [Saprospiraceae bacterium]|nr:hypothetical protein [Saprospiraceae bacterium]
MKILKIIIGPELCWIVLYIFSFILAWANKRSNFAYDTIVENAWLYVPLLSALIFGLYWIPYAEKNWLLLRIWIVSIIMGHVVLETILKAYSTQGPGIGMGYLAGILLLFIILVVGSILVKLIH